MRGTEFTTRPELLGTFGMAASTHHIASAVGLSVLERGGNAFDAAVAMAFTLHVVEPHNNGPGGDAPIMVRAGRDGPVRVLCGQGPAPAGATIAHYRDQGLELIPRSGLLAAVIPGAVPAWLTLLRDLGSWRLTDVLEPAVSLARDGWPVARLTEAAVAGSRALFTEHWPTSATFWMPDGQPPRTGARLTNPALADTWTRLVAEATTGGGGREVEIDRALAVWSCGFVAEELGAFAARACGDGVGNVYAGVLTAGDLAGWAPAWEDPVAYEYHGWQVNKCGPWSQGPVLLQGLALLRRFDVDSVGTGSAEFVHLVTEVMKLTYADRDTFYGDPATTAVPLDVLLSDRYNEGRAALVDLGQASLDYRPGTVPGHGAAPDYDAAVTRRQLARDWAARVTGEAAGAGPVRGDTCHLDVTDRWGNVVSATPSGGWLQSSPHIATLGFPLGSRAQMFWLDEAHPSALAPGKRPRTTLTPSLATADDGRTALAFGTPGGDGQDQWQLQLFLRLVHGGLGLQAAIDAPAFRSAHWPDSFWPRAAYPGRLLVEDRFGAEVLDQLARLGHDVRSAPPWSEGHLSAVLNPAEGFLRAAADPRGMQGYAAGR